MGVATHFTVHGSDVAFKHLGLWNDFFVGHAGQFSLHYLILNTLLPNKSKNIRKAINLINDGGLFLLGFGFGIFFAYGSWGGHLQFKFFWFFLVLIIISVKFKLRIWFKICSEQIPIRNSWFQRSFFKTIKILFHSELESPIKIYFFKHQIKPSPLNPNGKS